MSDGLQSALFDLNQTGDLTPPIFEPSGHGVALTHYGRHEGLHPGAFGAPFCDQGIRDVIDTSAGRVEIWHVCSSTDRLHDTHGCDRCGDTW